MATRTQTKGEAMVKVSLNWLSGIHYDRSGDKPCRICVKPTPLRERVGNPAHKACVEQAIEAQVLNFARGLIEAEQSTHRAPRLVKAA